MLPNETIQTAISYHLHHFEYKDAIFLAELLHAEYDNEDSLYTLARCWFQSGKVNCCYSLLTQRPCNSVQCRLLLGKACVELRRYPEAEDVLIGRFQERLKCVQNLSTHDGDANPPTTPSVGTTQTSQQQQQLDDDQCAQIGISHILEEDYGDSASYVAKMLGYICARTDRAQSAITFLKVSLRLNPFLWKSYELLIELGADVEPNSVFVAPPRQRSSSISNRSTMQMSAAHGHGHGHGPSPGNLNPNSNNVSLKRDISQSITQLRRSSRIGNTSRGNNLKENSSKSTPAAERIERGSKTPNKKPKRTSATTPAVVTASQRGENELNEINRNSSFNVLTEKKRDKEQTIPRPPDDENISKDITMPEHEEKQTTTAKPERNVPSPPPAINQSPGLNLVLSEDALHPLMKLGRLVYHNGRYEPDLAIEQVEHLNPLHRNVAYVLSHLGKAYFEKGNYEMACKYYAQARTASPHHVVGMEYYSTALWHLQKEKQLSSLALDMIKNDRNAPQTWCVAGNCFSLQKEHETAIKFLQRAINLDPEFAYGYTLLGHELNATEEMDHAMACFRNAIRIDPRHYNAWYGLGEMFFKQEKYRESEIHYRQAQQISPRSPVLLCNLGVARHSLKKTSLALETLDAALVINPKHALSKFHRATIYFQVERYNDALAELEELREIVPTESMVYFLIGRVHKNLNNTHLALMNFSWSMDLDPKGANNQIKEMIDRQNHPAEEEDNAALGWMDT